MDGKNRRFKSLDRTGYYLQFMLYFTLYPLIWLFLSAFKTNNEIYSTPFCLAGELTV